MYWLKNTGAHKYVPQYLLQLPGAIKSIVNDFNADGLPDILTLMTQADEGFYLFTNKGHGTFESRRLLSFPPVYGSSYFELADFNKDGFVDILYTCGDNADYTANILKAFHGVYIFLNDGRNNYRQQYFFAIHGCFKATARDFDLDGDLDIAAISYFPNTKSQPRESFTYLRQTTPFNFTPFAIKSFNEGRWLTMDAGDIDADGDDDIVLGNFVPPVESQEQLWKSSKVQRSSFMLLKNSTKN